MLHIPKKDQEVKKLLGKLIVVLIKNLFNKFYKFIKGNVFKIGLILVICGNEESCIIASV
jgi:hypothetical protein